MPNTPSPLGRNLKSVATYLTRWMRAKPAPKEKEMEKETEEPKEIIKIQKPKAIRSRSLPKIELAPDPIEEEVTKAKVAKAIKERIAPASIAATKKEVQSLDSTENQHVNPKPQTVTGENLLGKTVDITINNKSHTLMPRTDSLFIDAQKYIVSAGGGALGADVELDILEVRYAQKELTLRAGAFGKQGTVTLQDSDLHDLLQGKTCKVITDNNLTFEIARSSY